MKQPQTWELIKQWQELQRRPPSPVMPDFWRILARAARHRRLEVLVFALAGTLSVLYGVSIGPSPTAAAFTWLGLAFLAWSRYAAVNRK